MLKIFVIDDERLIRATTAGELREHGYNVKEFASAEAASVELRHKSGEVDIIPSGLKLPGVKMFQVTFASLAIQLPDTLTET